MNDTTNTLLLNLMEQMGDMRQAIGGINSQLETNAQTHARNEQTLDMLDRRTDITETMVVEIKTALYPKDSDSLIMRVGRLEIFHGKMGAIVAVASGVLSAVFTLIFIGVKWLIEHWSDVWSRFFPPHA